MRDSGDVSSVIYYKNHSHDTRVVVFLWFGYGKIQYYVYGKSQDRDKNIRRNIKIYYIYIYKSTNNGNMSFAMSKWLTNSCLNAQYWFQHSLSNCFRVNTTQHHWWRVNNGSGNSLVPSGNKPLSEPILSRIPDAIWIYKATMSWHDQQSTKCGKWLLFCCFIFGYIFRMWLIKTTVKRIPQFKLSVLKAWSIFPWIYV